MLLLAGNVRADQVILDDLIVDGSACIGFDCVNGESFGFDTLRLKENNLRLNFDDTSTSASFPGNDWRIVINDSSNGGANYFAIEDSTAARQIFRVDAGAPTNALRVDAQGDVGIGISTPVVELHIADGDTPTLRLEQNGSSGFTPQTWDVAGNETNFFVRDVTNGSTLPFRIRPGAPTSAIDINANGEVGIGTASPKAHVHIVDTNGGSGGMNVLMLEQNGNPELVFKNTLANKYWEFSAGNNFLFRETDVNGDSLGAPAFKIANTTGNLTIAGTITTSGATCGGGCDIVFEPDYHLPSIQEHAELMWKNKHLPNIGPTIENQPFDLTDKTGRMLNELEKAHIYIEQLHKRLSILEAKLAHS